MATTERAAGAVDTVQLAVRMRAELVAELRRLASEQGMPLRALIRRILAAGAGRSDLSTVNPPHRPGRDPMRS